MANCGCGIRTGPRDLTVVDIQLVVMTRVDPVVSHVTSMCHTRGDDGLPGKIRSNVANENDQD